MKKNLLITFVFVFSFLLLSGTLIANSNVKNPARNTLTHSKNSKALSLSNNVMPAIDPSLIQAMEYRMIGPYRGGRSPAVTGVPGKPFLYYMGASGGGVWKTSDAGTTWENISDGYFNCSSIGAIAVADSDPNVIYVGTGETNLRGDVQTGLGVYKSEDAGKTWKHIGLEDTGQIGRIRIHPDNPNLVYVAALGHAFGPNRDRGVFRSKDGGVTWEKILYQSDKAGAVDLAMDTNNPRILFAAIYQVIRKPWIVISGGEESGLYKSTDGGSSWNELKKGLPQGVLGRIGVAVSPANSDRVWINIEAKDDKGGVYRSDNGGNTFIQVNKEGKLRCRPFYFTHIFADPVDENTVYVLNLRFHKSIDGGKTYESIRVPHGDTQDLWLNPDDPNIMINGNDGGACVSLNGGKTWSTIMNQPTMEFYRVTTDDQFPYRVYGAQQDNSTVSVPSRIIRREIFPDVYAVGGGEQGHIWVDPRNPDVVYAGNYEGMLERYDHRTGQIRAIEAYHEMGEGIWAEALKYRIQMNAPVRLSPNDPNILYHCSQYVHKSLNEGQSWEIISPDLTRNDKSKQKPSGGPITLENCGPEIYCTIFAFEESPHEPGLLWAGTDDGLVHISRNEGDTWENITPQGMPEWGTVNMIELSTHDPGRAFIAVQRYRLDDFSPYVFRTNDYGKSWTLITKDNGIDSHHFVRVVREDPDRKGLLYAGTEFGIYVSFNDGKSWQSLQLNLPVVQVADMVVKEKDLVVATHGRSFWILDDLSPLHQLSEDVTKATTHLFKPKDAYRTQGREGVGAIFYYHLAEEPEGKIKLEFLDSEENLIQTFSDKEDNNLRVKPGLNRFVWDLRYPRADVVADTIFFGGNNGLFAVPGSYLVRMTVGEQTHTQSFMIKKDPRLSTTQAELEEQFDLAIKIRNKITDAHNAIRRIRDVRHQLGNLSLRLKKIEYEDIVEAGESLSQSLTSIEEKLMQTKYEVPGGDSMNFPPQVDAKLNWVLSRILKADTKPTDGAYDRFADLNEELAQYLERLKSVLDKDLTAYNDLIREKNLPPVLVPLKIKDE